MNIEYYIRCYTQLQILMSILHLVVIYNDFFFPFVKLIIKMKLFFFFARILVKMKFVYKLISCQLHNPQNSKIYLPTPKRSMAPILRDGHISYIEGWICISSNAIMHYSLYLEKNSIKAALLTCYTCIYLGKTTQKKGGSESFL